MTAKEPQPLDRAGHVIGYAMAVHAELGPGFNEIIYHNSLCLELSERGIDFESKPKLIVFYKTRPVGNYEADLIVEKSLLLELKAVEALSKAHEAQLVNYLAATRLDEGLLLNFSASSLQFKKKFRSYRPKGNPPALQS